MDADFRLERSRHAGGLKIMRGGGVRGDTWVFSLSSQGEWIVIYPREGKFCGAGTGQGGKWSSIGHASSF